MEFSRSEIEEIIAEMEQALDAMRNNGLHDSPSYVALWRRWSRLEETLYRHPY